MNRIRYYYLDSLGKEQLEDAIAAFLEDKSPQTLWQAFEEALPMAKLKARSTKKRVEGMIYLCERLWPLAIELGQKVHGAEFSRHDLIHSTQSKPMSYYHYTAGSREPNYILMTRDDALQDPTTAIVKLKQDVDHLVNFIHELPAEAATVE
ncbi:MAG: hypothetical protein NTW14_07760 [bacterium]|nr:hypothetical protein [bacterium]